MDDGNDTGSPPPEFAGGKATIPPAEEWPSFDEDGALSPAQADDLLFEDILELEGSLRASLVNAVPGLDVRAITVAAESIIERVTADAGIDLGAALQALDLASQAGDGNDAQAEKRAMISALTTLRQAQG